MTELYYVPNPDRTSLIGLIEAPVVGSDASDREHVYASLKDRITKAGQAERLGHRVLDAIGSGKGIPREFMLDVLEAVYMTADPGDVLFLNRDGLVTFQTEHRFMIPLLGDPHDEITVLDEAGEALATQLEIEETQRAEEDGRTPRAVMFGFRHELVWRENETGQPQPALLSNREHYALGCLATNGVFEPTLTILAKD